ncbi:MAG TPA: ATP-binding protein [Candidatus Acidoferrum sp.]|nr:ATP-binding protein [Candidatus Acidoferrum sp.]
MKELSLNILDIVENSTKANASLVEISLAEDTAAKTLVIEICDNGSGMSPELLARVTDPFTTTRTTRKVGLGLPLFKLAAEQTGGGLVIESTVGFGTKVRATFHTDHLDFTPVGDMGETFSVLLMGHPDTDFVFTRSVDEKSFGLSTKEMREMLGGVSLAEPEVLQWAKEYIHEQTKALRIGGAINENPC